METKFKQIDITLNTLMDKLRQGEWDVIRHKQKNKKMIEQELQKTWGDEFLQWNIGLDAYTLFHSNRQCKSGAVLYIKEMIYTEVQWSDDNRVLKASGLR